jgi:hypothetical protein
MTFNEFLAEQIEEVHVELPEDILLGLNLVMEGYWSDAARSGWSYRVDPENTSTLTQRHVHIAKSKHVSTKDQQASWNKDGSRHDKSTFNSSVGNKDFVQQLARDVLNIPDSIMLESYGSVSVEPEVMFNPQGRAAYVSFA